MTIKTQAPIPTPISLAPLRRTAFIGGALYLLTFVSSIPAVFLLAPVLDDPNYIVGSGQDTRVLLGCFLDVINALACIGTAVALYPVVKRQNQSLAIGFITSRVMEAAIIFIGITSLLSVITLRRDLAGAADPDTLVMIGQSLVATRDWTFLLGPTLMAGINALLLGTLMYRSRLVPRLIPILGLIGGPLLIAATTAVMFGASPTFLAAAAPVAAWEFSLGAYLVIKGFLPNNLIQGAAGSETVIGR